MFDDEYIKEMNRRYPFLTDPDGETSWIHCMPEGWWISFGEQMCEEIQQKIDETKDEDFTILDLKEKYGSLRLYPAATTKDIDDIIDKYEFISRKVCCICGKPDVPMVFDSWISPYCRKCWCKHIYRGKGNAEKKYENIIDPSEPALIPDKYEYMIYNGQDHQEKTVSVDISETVRKIRENFKKRCDNEQ